MLLVSTDMVKIFLGYVRDSFPTLEHITKQ
jgi:hypothetical protein